MCQKGWMHLRSTRRESLGSTATKSRQKTAATTEKKQPDQEAKPERLQNKKARVKANDVGRSSSSQLRSPQKKKTSKTLAKLAARKKQPIARCLRTSQVKKAKQGISDEGSSRSNRKMERRSTGKTELDVEIKQEEATQPRCCSESAREARSFLILRGIQRTSGVLWALRQYSPL
jgi:hypothetical protein